MYEIRPGQIIDGRYQVLGELSRGGMGALYHIRHRLTGREEALKVILAEKASWDSYRKRFLTEATAVSRLESPHTVTLFDCGYTDDGLLYFTMELLKGHSLDQVIGREGPMEWRRAVRLAVQACLSLEEAHAHEILHRDLKPSNLFLTSSQTNDEHLKVLDFGIARLRTEPGEVNTTTPGLVLGTPCYMSPEQAEGAELDEQSDIYSMGLVLYEMLAGRRPFEAKDFSALREKLRKEIPTPVGLATPGVVVPGGLEKTVLACLAKDSADRPTSFRELRMTLEAILTAGARDDLPTTPVKAKSSSLALETTADSVDEKGNGRGLPQTETGSVSALTLKPPGKGRGKRRRVAGRSVLRFLRSLALPVTLAGVVLLGLAAQRLGPVRWLDEKGGRWRQEFALFDEPGRGVVVQMGLEEDVLTLRTQGRPVPGTEGVATWRLLDALLVRRLAEAEAGVVAFDKYYGDDHEEETAGLAEAVREAGQAGIPVVLGTLHRPPPELLHESGAWFGSALAARSGFDGHIRSLLTGSTLLDGTDVPSLFVLAWCLSREPPIDVGVTTPALEQCLADVQGDESRWKLRFSRQHVRTLRASDVLAWPVDELKERVKGKVVFVGSFEPGSDEVKVPAIPGLQSPEGTVHGVMLLATAYNQLDQHAHWVQVPAWAPPALFLLLGFAPFLLLRRKRVHVPLLVAGLLLVAATLAGLLLPVDYAWGTAVAWGVLALAGGWGGRMVAAGRKQLLPG